MRISEQTEASATGCLNWPGARPAPGGPANAWAIVSQWSATGPVRRHCGVGAMPALGHQQAEVERRAGDPVGGVSGSPGPQLSGRGDELDPDRRGRDWQSVRDVAERAGADADVRHVPEPVRRLALRADGIGDVLAVRPRLHQPGGQRGRDAHGRPEPRHPRGRIQAGEDGQQLDRARGRTSRAAPPG